NGEVFAPLIIEALRNKGYIVTKLSLTKPTLNEVYLEYTGRAFRDTNDSEDFKLKRLHLWRVRRK
ncbi:MAG: hypothetical protein QXW27_03425, partial [Candidatus Methanomethylicaceae archaeon]